MHRRYSDVADALYTSYKALVLGAFDETVLFPRHASTTVFRVVVLTTSLVTTVVVLNMLIARMAGNVAPTETDACTVPV